MIRLLLILLITLSLQNCETGAAYLDPMSTRLSDSGGLNRMELERAAAEIAAKIVVNFKKNPEPGGVFLVITATKNDTSEQIPTDVFENALVRNVKAGGIYTLRTDKREDQLKQISINQKLGGDMSLDLKSPNYFVRTKIDENMFTNKGDKIVEQVLNVELVKVSSLEVAFTDKVVFTKKAVSNKGMGW